MGWPTQNKTSVALESREDFWLLDCPSSYIGEDFVSDGGLLGGSGDGPSRLRDLLLELLDEWSLDAGGLMLVETVIIQCGHVSGGEQRERS